MLKFEVLSNLLEQRKKKKNYVHSITEFLDFHGDVIKESATVGHDYIRPQHFFCQNG